MRENNLERAFEENIDDTDEYARFVGYDLKWYPSYADVKTINDFIEETDEDGNYKNRGLIEIGEDDATETHGNTYEIDMYTTSDVEW